MFLDNFAGDAAARAARAAAIRRDAGRRRSVRAIARVLRASVNGASGMLGRLLYTDIKTYLVELLMKQDQMSMSASIESRVPFLDHVLVEFAARLPDRLKLRGFTTKRILREAVAGLLPDEILTRKKMGFPVPFGAVDARHVARVVARCPARSPDARARRHQSRRPSSSSRRPSRRHTRRAATRSGR